MDNMWPNDYDSTYVKLQSNMNPQSSTKTNDTRSTNLQKCYYDTLPSENDYIMENNGDATMCFPENVQGRQKSETKRETHKPIKIGTYDGTTPF